jgi:ABC-type dipeptide/oligopeptide/nickel transport system permease subunit
MSSSRKADRSIALLPYLGIFLFIPVWDFYALYSTLREGWLARGDREARSSALYPIRRLIFLFAAYGLALIGVGLLQGRIAQPGPFGILITGLNHLSGFSTSQVLAPGVPVGELIGTHLPNSLWLFLLTSLITGLFSASMVALTTVIDKIGLLRRLSGFLGWGIGGVLAIPVGAISLLVIHVAAIRMGIVPTDYSMIAGAPFAARIGWLMLPACVIALFPALICTRAGLSAGPESPTRWLQMGQAFLDQAGWIISSLIVVEAIFRIPGLGWLAWQSITLADAPVLAGAMKVFVLFMLIMRTRSAITAGVLKAGDHENESQPARKPINWGRAAVVGLFLLIVIGSILLPLVASLGDPYQADFAAIYARRSPDHLLGTDHLGRDVFSRVLEAQRVSWGMALIAGMVAASFGGLWGTTAGWVRKRRGLIGETLADLILLPAEAAILLHPVLIVLALGLLSGSGEPITGMGVLIGLALVPRIAWLIGSQPGKVFSAPLSFKHITQSGIALFTMATFVSLLYSVSIDMLGSGVATPTASAGNLLSRFGELITSEIVIRDGRFIRLVVYLALPGVISCWGGYLFQDFLADQPDKQSKDWLPRMLS